MDIEEREVRERKRNVVSGTWIGVGLAEMEVGEKGRVKKNGKEQEERRGGGADSDYEMMVRFLQNERKT